MKLVKVDLITRFEGFESKPYLCSAGVPTIGYGSTYYADGTKVQLNDDKVLTKDDAIELLKANIVKFEDVVNNNIDVPLNQKQFDALVSFAYNVGVNAFRDSTLLKKLNNEDYIGAADEFLRWNKIGSKISRGLTARRVAERALFLS